MNSNGAGLLEQVQEAMHVAFIGKDSTQRKVADRWIADFQSSYEAWQISDLLLQQEGDQYSDIFGAILLYNKIRDHFQQLDESSVEQLKNTIVEHLTRKASYQPPKPTVISRLCLALAALAVQMNQQGVLGDILSSMNVLLQTSPRVVLELVTLLPEECMNDSIDVDSDIRQMFSSELRQSAPNVLSFLGSMLEHPSTDTQQQVLRCLHKWVQYGDVDPAHLGQSAALQFSFEALRRPELLDSAVDMLVSLLRRYPWSIDDYDADARELISVVVPAVLNIKDFFLSACQEEDEDAVCSLCRLFTELAESCLPVILSNASFDQTGILDILLQCSAYPQPHVCGIPGNFWYQISIAILKCEDQRESQALRERFGPYYNQLVQVCINQMKLPPDADRMQEGLLEDSRRLRKDFSDTMEDCCTVLGPYMCLEQISARLQAEVSSLNPSQLMTSWNVIEACLQATNAIAVTIPEDESDVLPALLQFLPSVSEHPLIRLTAYEIVGKLSKWLNEHEQMIEAMFEFVFQGLSHKQTSPAAAQAVKCLCKGCATKLGAPVFHLHDSLLQIRPDIDSSSGALSLDDELNILEGLCHVIDCLPFEEAQQGLFTMVQPILTNLESTLKTSPGNTKSLFHDLERLTVISRQTDIHLPKTHTNKHMHPLVQAFQQAWPWVQQCASAHITNPYMAEKVCRYYKHTIRQCKEHFASQAPAMCEHLGLVFEASKQSPYLYAGGICVQEYSDRPDFQALLYNMFGTFTHSFFSIVTSVEDFEQNPDIVEEYFYLVAKYLEQCPGPLLHEQDTMRVLIDAGLAGVSVQHRQAQKSALHFFEQLVDIASPRGSKSRSQEIMGAASHWIEGCAGQLLVNLFKCLAGQMPAYAIDEGAGSFTDLLWALKIYNVSKLNAWVLQALSNIPERPRQEALRSRLADVMCSETDQRRFGDVIYDFYRKCKHRSQIYAAATKP